MIDTSNYSISKNPEENGKISQIAQRKNVLHWVIYFILLSLGGGISYSWYFLTQKLIPLIEKPVSDYISRPVKLGKIKAVSLTSIRLGETRIDTTTKENDYIIAEGVEINFSPLQILANQDIKLGINILNPQGFLQQNKDNSWIKINLNNKQNNNNIFLGKSIHINNIALENGNLIIKGNQRQGIIQEDLTKINLPFGNILFKENQQIFEVKGNLNDGSKIIAIGLHYPQKKEWLIKLNTKDLATNNVNNLLNIPVNADSGKVSGNLFLNFVKDNLEKIEGNLFINQVNLTIPNIPNKLTKTEGNIKISNKIINLKNIETNLDLIPAKVNGSIENNHLNLQVATKNYIEIDKVFSSLKIDTRDLITQGKIRGDLMITGNINKPKIATKIISVGKTQIDKITFEKIAGDLDIISQKLIINNFELLPTIGGKVIGNGKINLGKKDDSFLINWQGIDIEGEKIATLYQQKLPMTIGLVNGDYQLFGNWRNLQESRLTGNSIIELGEGKATINNFEINPQTWQGEVNLSGLRLTQLPNLDCEKIGCSDSLLNGEFFVTGNREEITPEEINLTGKFNFNLAGGRVILNNTSLQKGNWETKMTLNNLSLSQLPSINMTSPVIKNGRLKGELQVAGVLNKNDEMVIQGKGNLFLPQGKVDIDNFNFQNDNFIAQTNLRNFSLADFADNFRGGVTGDITWRGDVNNLTADSLNLKGNLIFNEGINIIHQPISTDFVWNGKVLEIKEARLDRATSLYDTNDTLHDRVLVKGFIDYDIETETLKDVNLEIIGKEIDLHSLPLSSSLDIVNYQGNIDFQGRLVGNISQPTLTGKVNLNNFQLANIGFSSLKGDLTTSAKEGINLHLDSTTTEDKFYLEIDNKNQPQKIEIQNNNSRIEAIRETETLAVTANNIPLDKVTKTWLTYLPENIKKIEGSLSADIKVNLIDNNFIASNVVIEKPALNNFKGDILTTQLFSEGDVIQIEKGKINHKENEYLFSGELTSLGNNPQVKGKVEIKEGDIQNFLRSWEIFELKDFSMTWQPKQYGKANDLYSSPQKQTKEKVTSPVISISDNSKEKATSPVVSISSDNSKEKATSPVVSISSDNSKEKATSPVVSISSDNSKEKSTSPVVSISSDNSKEKSTSPVVSISSDNSKEKSTSPVVSISSDNSKEKSTSPVVSISSDNSKEKSTSPVVSISSDNSKEKVTSPVVSISSDNSKEKSTSPVVSISSDNSKEKVTSPVVSISSDNSKEKATSPVVSISSDNSKEKATSPVVSISDNELKPLASINSDDDSLLDTLAFFRKIQTEFTQQEVSRINASIPALEDLQGNFRGKIDFSFSFNKGLQTEFDFRGDDWQWGKHEGNFLQATGSFNDGLLTLLPIQIQSDNSILSLTGTYSKERISGEIKLSDFSISQFKEVVNIPKSLDIEGIINANIAISGSEEKPLAKGNIEIINSKINGTKIDETTASFGFRNSRIDFLANSNLTKNNQPLIIIGSLPFQLFPNSIIPNNNNFKISLNLSEDGFGLLNILTNNQLNWLKGDGNINLDINGKYYQLTNQITNVETQGIAMFKDGIIDGKILADKSITNINGEVFFNFSQLTIPNLTGNFSGGNISINGSLPLIDSTFSNDMLTISIDDLALDIDSLYQGNAQGTVSISGSSIKPEIGGKIKLYNGEILIKDNSRNQESIITNKGIISNIKINDLDLILGKNINISQPPLLDLTAEGSLKINGNLSNLKPDGIINLTRGNLNLFTSQFNLANGNNIARFTPENGFNPYLDLQLESRVTETNRYKLIDNSNPNEIRDLSNSSVNTAQTVRVKATIKGWSDNLKDDIELSSSPQRSQNEIVALLGGGFFDNFTEGDSNLGLANLASAALLGSVQGQLQKNFGFNQLRLFPTQIFNSEKRTSTLAFGAELGLDITDNFSISITKILTEELAPQYNIIYRLNDKTILRGSSDFEQDTLGIIEFEHRF
ncbi:translocation/assembly module TamB domain-containing protein [Geminocystis sp. NIES-3709]|uniref:translocation/assembly module TamB domain-containing protein n=1 Tax=Geminocystis sp. NIES-3709 TaxID=1617448 RepID=UPI0005FCD60E|nr:translocation/assembly module TamB domain-containing protein [Geminocystis sp. NIES-3709]BAQ64918.1 protein of unknown function DUF490 [Geminocystis sp. NIES-3709]